MQQPSKDAKKTLDPPSLYAIPIPCYSKLLC